MSGFSSVDIQMRQFAESVQQSAKAAPIAAWPESERSARAVAKRRAQVQKSFRAFDQLYFPPDMYAQGYYPACAYHQRIIAWLTTPGVDIGLGPRGFAKTATAKKGTVWLLLTGRISVGGTYCETLPKAQNLLDDIVSLIRDNERLQHDFAPTILEANADQFEFRMDGVRRTMAAFSEGRSLRGFTRMFLRPEFLLGDDIETLQSPMGREQSQMRIRKLSEAYQSLTTGGSMVILGNDFRDDSALHQLRIEAERGILPESWRVHVDPAWSRGRSLWPARFSASSEEEMKRIVGVIDEADWQANYQQNPIPPDGFILPREHWQWFDYRDMPNDARGVIYADQNLALKGKGDTTAIVRMLYSPSTDMFYVTARCRSYNDPSAMLSDMLELRSDRVRALALDGHVTQESHWTHHIRAWCRDHGQPFPTVEFRRYRVDELATNFQTQYVRRRVAFDRSMENTDEGRTFMVQFFAFHTKKAGRHDDAPDACISCHQYLTDRKLIRRVGSDDYRPTIISDVYSGGL